MILMLEAAEARCKAVDPMGTGPMPFGASCPSPVLQTIMSAPASSKARTQAMSWRPAAMCSGVDP